MASIPVSELTESKVDGKGVFDELMKATKAHLDQEYNKNRLKGPDYASVYLGSVQEVMKTSLKFLMERERTYQQAELIKAQVQTEKNQHLLQAQQLLNAKDEGAILKLQATLLGKQITKAEKENELLEEQRKKLVEDTKLVVAQTKNAGREFEVMGKQMDKLVEDTKLAVAQTKNAGREFEVMGKQMCKLDAEYDVLIETKTKVMAETGVLNQKIITERAQTQATGVVEDSVIGRQKGLYLAQADGLKRDAEQKAAKLLVDSWSVRRTTDNGTQANTSNGLSDTHVGRAVNKLLSGVNA